MSIEYSAVEAGPERFFEICPDPDLSGNPALKE